MKNDILNLLAKQDKIHFEYESGSINPVKHLKEASKFVPDVPGVYLVFCRSQFYDCPDHLKFEMDGVVNSLVYFGKAGGVTKNGKKINQGLYGRLNNVISDSNLNLKDIKRADYWQIITAKYGIEKLKIVCLLHENPQMFEETLYNFLNKNLLEYPLLNKKRGRTKNSLNLKSN